MVRLCELSATSRDGQHEWFRIADARTGAVRTAFEDSAPGYYRSGIDAVSWRYLPKADQAIWYSERTNWGNLYLYDLKAGTLEHPITTGVGDVTEVLHVDRRTRTVWFRAVGRTPGLNPYYEQLWKASLDGGKATATAPRSPAAPSSACRLPQARAIPARAERRCRRAGR